MRQAQVNVGNPCPDLQAAGRQAHQVCRRDRGVVDLGAKCCLETGIFGGACDDVLDLIRAP